MYYQAITPNFQAPDVDRSQGMQTFSPGPPITGQSIRDPENGKKKTSFVANKMSTRTIVNKSNKYSIFFVLPNRSNSNKKETKVKWEQ